MWIRGQNRLNWLEKKKIRVKSCNTVPLNPPSLLNIKARFAKKYAELSPQTDAFQPSFSFCPANLANNFPHANGAEFKMFPHGIDLGKKQPAQKVI